MAILARMLSPEDFGSMGVALVVMAFTSIFVDLGMTSLVIQRDDIDQVAMSTIFWTNIFIGCFMFAIIFVVSPWIAAFYETPSLTKIIRWVGVSFLISPFEMLFLAILQKKFQFKSLAKREVSSKLLGFAVGVLAAWMGFGVFSLVALHLATLLTSCLFIIPKGLEYFRPSISHFSPKAIRPFLPFAGYMTGDALINYFNRQIDNILIGKVAGLSNLGGYSISKNFTIRPYTILNPIITQVTFPILSKNKGNNEILADIYFKTLNYLSSANFGIYMFIVLFSNEIVTILFGPQWFSVIPLVKIMSMTFMVRSIFNPMGTLIVAKGKPQLSFYWNLSQLLLVPAVVIFSAEYGITWIAISQLLLLLLLLYPAFRWLVAPLLSVSVWQLFKQLLSPALTCLLTCLFTALLQLITIESAWIRVIFGAAVFFGMYLFLLYRFNLSFRQLLQGSPRFDRMLKWVTRKS